MQTSILELNCKNQIIPITVERKKIKTIRLKVYPESVVKISSPYSITDEFLMEFVSKRQKWIEDKLEKFSQTKGYAATTVIKNGMSIKMLGEDLIFSVRPCEKNLIYREGKILHICTTYADNQEKLMQQFDKWWRKESLEILKQQVDDLYPIIKKYDIPYPSIYLKKMKTLWGSCSVNRNKVTFNQYLTKAKPACIEYVVLHELVHFLYPNHSKKFYDFLSSYMPDWKDRKKVLDTEVVHGL